MVVSLLSPRTRGRGGPAATCRRAPPGARRRGRSRSCPRSSETRIASASVSSVMPMAARCRVPKRFGRSSLSESGRKLAAAATRSPEMMTAPSCSGVPGAKTRHEQLVGDRGVDARAVLDVGLQALPPLEHDERARRAGPRARSRRGRSPTSSPRRGSRRRGRRRACARRPRARGGARARRAR